MNAQKSQKSHRRESKADKQGTCADRLGIRLIAFQKTYA